MNIQLIQGEFNASEAVELITQMIHVKIKFHEQKINQDSSEEDVKYRESKIKHLQKELFQLRNLANHKKDSMHLTSEITIK